MNLDAFKVNLAMAAEGMREVTGMLQGTPLPGFLIGSPGQWLGMARCHAGEC